MAQNLDRPIVLANGGSISKVAEALDFYFSLPTRERTESHWTEAAKLLVATFEDGNDLSLERAERQFRLALARLAN